jgi:hypothetical protein
VVLEVPVVSKGSKDPRLKEANGCLVEEDQKSLCWWMAIGQFHKRKRVEPLIHITTLDFLEQKVSCLRRSRILET